MMDLLVQNDYLNTNLSSLGIVITDFDETIPELNPIEVSFNGRNGSIPFGGNFKSKKINLSGYLTVKDLSTYENIRNSLYQLFRSDKPFYITPLFGSESMYNFERPGQNTGEVFVKDDTTKEGTKRFYVRLGSTFIPDFIGKINGKLKYKLAIEFVTAQLPFGESKPITSDVESGKFSYKGTMSCSQLEVPFIVEFKANAKASAISLKIDGTEWTYKGDVASGDTFTIAGMYNRKGSTNINDDTNMAYFILNPNANKSISVTCSVGGSITIKNYKELYL